MFAYHTSFAGADTQSPKIGPGKKSMTSCQFGKAKMRLNRACRWIYFKGPREGQQQDCSENTIPLRSSPSSRSESRRPEHVKTKSHTWPHHFQPESGQQQHTGCTVHSVSPIQTNSHDSARLQFFFHWCGRENAPSFVVLVVLLNRTVDFVCPLDQMP